MTLILKSIKTKLLLGTRIVLVLFLLLTLLGTTTGNADDEIKKSDSAQFGKVVLEQQYRHDNNEQQQPPNVNEELPTASKPPPPIPLQTGTHHHHPPTTQLTTDPLQSLLLISTLDGSLTALDSITGELRWTTRDKPIIQVPNTSQNHHHHSLPSYFLPDPKTGSLYMMGKQNNLRKLPFTIPQLVARAPCRNSEGLMYTGRKHDVWVSLNPYTGEKREFSGGGGSDDSDSCSSNSWGSNSKYAAGNEYCDATSATKASSKKNLLIGKTEYMLSMRDGPMHWNVTYNHYTSKEPAKDYELVHFSSPSEGNFITYDRSGELLWQVDLNSPVIGVYSVEQQGLNLVSVPFNPIAGETLERLRDSGHHHQSNKALSQTTYVGECAYGLYAVPALADDNQRLITSGSVPLLEGPGGRIIAEEQQHNIHGSGTSNSKDFLLLGYYEIIEGSGSSNLVPQIEGKQHEHEGPPSSPDEEHNSSSNFAIPPTLFDNKVIPIDNNDINSNNARGGGVVNQKHVVPPPTTPNNKQFPPLLPNKKRSEIKIVFTTAIISILVTSTILGILFIVYRRYKNEQLAMQVKMLSNDSVVSEKSFVIAGEETLTVGKITLFPSEILGKGCEGTFVYKGKFEGRNVAVKRILPECFQFADREVDLLKESDQHQNVVRYFCTETDGQFRYIALELCVATLADWVEGRWKHEAICDNGIELLRGASEGLRYLHSLRIVHRDVKPANVLLSLDPGSGGVRTMISDFGLCKKIQAGRGSYSRRSGGVPGTDGWIAPEVLYYGEEFGGYFNNGSGAEKTRRMTYSVDIFSMGCIYYYVLTKGQHPFGDPFRRQSNILQGTYNLDRLHNHPLGAQPLIAQMISTDPTARPPLDAVVQHPLFWSNEKILNFFLDVSDRIEKENEETCAVLRKFEAGAGDVVRGDWRDHICVHVAMDLRRFRTYRGESVRDLLRALRNKKNHYRELGREVKESLGEVPDQFVNYWVGRFPRLLEYTWGVFEGVKYDMKGYYSGVWDFYDNSDIGGGNGDNNGNGCYGIDEEEDTGSSGGSGDGGVGGGQERTSSSNKISKDFWKSKNQGNKYQRWRGGGGGGGRGRGGYRRFKDSGGGAMEQQPRETQQQPGGGGGEELSASTDNYWRNKSPVKK